MNRGYSTIKYTNNFLNQVILRVDFLQFLSTQELFSDTTEKVILKHFSMRGIDKKVSFDTINVKIDPNKMDVQNTQKETIEGIQREYNKGKNKIILSNKFLIYDIKEYNTFENHYALFQDILAELFRNQKITSARIGVRYINIFEASRIKLRKNMFSQGISASLNIKDLIPNNELLLTRSMSLSEYQLNNMLLKFRFGMFNPDYPNPLDKGDFALDYDCYTTEPMESTGEILQIVTRGHDAIQELFEASITDSLRKILNNG